TRALRNIQKSEFEFKRGFFRPSFQRWLCNSEGALAKVEGQTLPTANPERTYALYEADSKLRVFSSDEHEGTSVLRYLLEGRGIETAGWTLSFNATEDLQSFEPFGDELLALEPSNSPLRDRACEKLKQNSLHALMPAKAH